MPITASQIETLRRLQEDTNADAAWQQKINIRHQRRRIVISEMRQLLTRFLGGQATLREFKDTFDQKTRSDWDVFGLKGTSGAMFLNMMVNNVPDTNAVARELKSALLIPDEAEALPKMRRFFDFLVQTKASGTTTRGRLQPNRVPFFLSTWWHIQDQEPWPPYYISARRVLSSMEMFVESNNSIADYFRFRSVWRELASALGLETWALESVFIHTDESPHQVVPSIPTSPIAEAIAPPPVAEHSLSEQATAEPVEETRAHSEIQWMLAKIGHQLGCRVWVASNDRSQVVNGLRLGSLSIPELPNLGIGDRPQNLVRLIDVIWLRAANHIVAAFEIESTTSIYSGLLRMADLNTLCPNLSFPCYIVVPDNRQEKVRRELSRPSFEVLGLPARCGYFSFEDLRRDYDALIRLATSPEAIRRLAKFVKDSEQPASDD